MLIINTLIPIFLLILLGYFFKHLKFPDEDFWKHLDKFNYFVLFPTLLVYKLSTADIHDIISFDFIIVASVALFVVSVLIMVLNKIMKFENSSFTSIFQGAIRFNTYVFLALTHALLSDENFVLGMLLITFIIPLLNILCISIFALYVPKSKITTVSLLKSIFKNPLILACLFGGTFNMLGLSFPSLLENTLSILSSAALPLGLLSVGVGLHLSSINETKLAVSVSLFAKLVLLPVIMYATCLLFGLDNDKTILLVLFASMPTASSAYALARELGGDLKLISSIVSLQTVVSIFSISFILWLLHIG